MPPDAVAIGLAAMFVGGALYAEWVAWAPSTGESLARRVRLVQVAAVHALALLQLALAAGLVLAT